MEQVLFICLFADTTERHGTISIPESSAMLSAHGNSSTASPANPAGQQGLLQQGGDAEVAADEEPKESSPPAEATNCSCPSSEPNRGSWVQGCGWRGELWGQRTGRGDL